MVPETVKCGEKRESEKSEENGSESDFPVVLPHPSPEYEPFSEQNDTKEEFKSHAFNLKVHLEVVSVFGKVSTFSFSGKNNSDQSTRSILSFEENDSSHLSPKIRRSSTPCVSSTNQVPFLGETNFGSYVFKEGCSNTALISPVAKIKAEKPRKRSWDGRLFTKP